MELDTLVARYGKTDAEIKALTKENNADKEQIKKLMEELGETDWVSGGYKVKRVVATSETINEEKLLHILQNNRELLANTGVLKMKEYVDMEALEAAIYEELLPLSLLTEMDNCRESKTTVQLRCSKAKEPTLEPILVEEV